ncbi:unnamed protein product [Ectocarpus sp. 4 AP-2014]
MCPNPTSVCGYVTTIPLNCKPNFKRTPCFTACAWKVPLEALDNVHQDRTSARRRDGKKKAYAVRRAATQSRSTECDRRCRIGRACGAAGVSCCVRSQQARAEIRKQPDIPTSRDDNHTTHSRQKKTKQNLAS